MDFFGIFFSDFGILKPFGAIYRHLLHFLVIWYILSLFGTLHLATLSRAG
jgi:hypothetical protein